MSKFPPRPKSYDKAFTEAACREILAEVQSWIGEPCDADEILADLVRCADPEAYRFARNLEDRCGYDPDTDLVDILEGYSTYEPHRAAVKAWVSENGISVPYETGQEVMLRGRLSRIVNIKTETAEIVVQPVEPDGRNYGETGGWVHPFEDAKQPAPLETS